MKYLHLTTLCFFAFLVLYACNPEKNAVAEYNRGLNIEVNDKDSELSISRGPVLLTIFHYADTFTKPFFFPVNSIEGSALTRGFPYDPRPLEPVDHPHQTGMWFSFGDINAYDFWNNSYAIPDEKKLDYGTIRLDSLEIISADSLSPSFRTWCLWIGGREDTLLEEVCRYEFKAEENTWSMTRNTELIAHKDIKFSDNKEGMFAIRVIRELQSDTGKKTRVLDSLLQPSGEDVTADQGKTGFYFSSAGREGADVWGTSNKWVSLRGIKEGDSLNIIIFDHPSNFGFPSFWHARDYGLFSVDNFGRKAFDPNMDAMELNLKNGESIQLKHKIIFRTDSFMNKEEIEERFSKFAG